MRALGDRRARLRFEVVGTLRGTLETMEPARLVNISGTGALVETPVAMQVDSIQVVQVTLDGQATRVTARVRHQSRIGQYPERIHYVVGLEFLTAPAALLESVSHLMADRRAD